MNTLLIRLSGKMQSFGNASHQWEKNTMDFPTKSAVIGMLGNAAGKLRTDSLDEYKGLRVCCLIEREGVKMVDFQIAGSSGGCKSAEGKIIRNKDGSIGSKRVWKEYLQDCKFIVSIESENLELLEKIENDLKHPKRILSLGRKCCNPSESIPIKGGLKVGMNYEEAFRSYMEQWGLTDKRLVVECVDGNERIFDEPDDYSIDNRNYLMRKIKMVNSKELIGV